VEESSRPDGLRGGSDVVAPGQSHGGWRWSSFWERAVLCVDGICARS